MICPRCHSRNELGVSQCGNCGAPFTRRAARRSRPDQSGGRQNYNYQQPQPQAAGAYEEYPPQRRQAPPRRQRHAYRRTAGPGNRAIGGLIAFLIVTIVVITAAAWLSSGDTTSRIGDGLSDTIAGVAPFGSDDDGPDVEVPEVPPEPQGEQTWTLSEGELNERIRNNPDAFSPASDVRVELNEGTVTIRFRAYGVNGTYHGSLTTRDGVPVVADSTIDGSLGFIIGSSQIDEALNREMASVVAEQDVSVESVHVRPGEMIFGISG
jgi:hypothetical protein